ncbi:hypothetical protein Sjap_005325 [Stephania japonica]|uniref:Uncharacterized protein n=1 Tax=Stephania japonica TaxID=461633 RepID=A0AAP0K3V8_9MAGN
MSALEHLNLSFSRIGVDNISPSLVLGESLRYLNLSNTRLTSTGLGLLVGNLPHIESLLLSHTGVFDSALSYISTMESLKVLDLSNTNIKDESLRYTREELLELQFSPWSRAIPSNNGAVMPKTTLSFIFAALYQNKVNSGRYSAWNDSSSSPRDWPEITCAGERVTVINLSNCNLSGNISGTGNCYIDITIVTLPLRAIRALLDTRGHTQFSCITLEVCIPRYIRMTSKADETSG